MARIVITSGPTREFLDPVRYLTNISTGRMGVALTAALLAAGHEVIVVSGPVTCQYPVGARVISVLSTQEMLEAVLALLPDCDGLIGAAAPCDFRPESIQSDKITKQGLVAADSGGTLALKLIETPDIIASCVRARNSSMTDETVPRPWIVAFAMETSEHRQRAIAKIQRKGCEWIVLNDASAAGSARTRVELIDSSGVTVGEYHGTKEEVAAQLVAGFNKTVKRPFSV